jgi:hypothetical protein
MSFDGCQVYLITSLLMATCHQANDHIFCNSISQDILLTFFCQVERNPLGRDQLTCTEIYYTWSLSKHLHIHLCGQPNQTVHYIYRILIHGIALANYLRFVPRCHLSIVYIYLFGAAPHWKRSKIVLSHKYFHRHRLNSGFERLYTMINYSCAPLPLFPWSILQ